MTANSDFSVEPTAMDFSAQVIATGLGYCEGPVVRASGGLIACSMSEACVWDIGTDGATVLAFTGGGANGLAEGRDGSIYVAQLGWRGHVRPENRSTGGIQVVSPESSVSWITQDPVAPNDLCFGPDELLYFTDPTRRPWEDGRLWRVDVEVGEAQLLTSLSWYPNGIGFGLEDDGVYVASTTGAEVVRFPLHEGGLGKPETFARLPYGRPDGFAFDADGNLMVCAVHLEGEPGELQLFDPNGHLLDRRRLGSSSLYTNIAVDSAGVAFITDTQNGELLRVEGWARPGLPLHPFRA